MNKTSDTSKPNKMKKKYRSMTGVPRGALQYRAGYAFKSLVKKHLFCGMLTQTDLCKYMYN